MSKKSKIAILMIVNFVLELSCTFLIWNGVLCTILPSIPSLNLLEILGLEFAVSWFKLNTSKYSAFKESDEDEKLKQYLCQLGLFVTFFVISLIIYLLVMFNK